LEVTITIQNQDKKRQTGFLPESEIDFMKTTTFCYFSPRNTFAMRSRPYTTGPVAVHIKGLEFRLWFFNEQIDFFSKLLGGPKRPPPNRLAAYDPEPGFDLIQ
jgi:hypothetical protein